MRKHHRNQGPWVITFSDEGREEPSFWVGPEFEVFGRPLERAIRLGSLEEAVEVMLYTPMNRLYGISACRLQDARAACL